LSDPKMSDPKNFETHGLTAPGDGQPLAKENAGKYSSAEILSQPECWQRCLTSLENDKSFSGFAGRFEKASGWVFIGCGSSYYVAQSAAATALSLTGRRAQAIPASELLLYPEATLAATDGLAPVLISRSGRTSEVIKAAELLKSRGIPTLAVTCAPRERLEKLADAAILLSAADEQSMVMTRSFSSMLLALQVSAARAAGDSSFVSSLRKMPPLAAPIFKRVPAEVRKFVEKRHFSDYVCLGQGPFFGLASEYALKLTEMSLSYSQAFHTLEFRHGPKSMVGPETLLVFLLSDSGFEAEREVLEEMKALGGTTLTVTNRTDARVRAASDLVVELSLDLPGDMPELARLAPTLLTGQLLGLYTGLHKGQDPDSPRNLSRVVTLDKEPSRAS
jgi:glutamine---fructose-6-phosphate transaminase (isomerizing)